MALPTFCWCAPCSIRLISPTRPTVCFLLWTHAETNGHHSVPVPIRGCRLQTLLTLPWLTYISCLPFFFRSLFPPSSPHLPLPSIYMSIICQYSCYIGLYHTISSYTGFATCDDAYDVMLGLHHNAELFSVAPDRR